MRAGGRVRTRSGVRLDTLTHPNAGPAPVLRKAGCYCGRKFSIIHTSRIANLDFTHQATYSYFQPVAPGTFVEAFRSEPTQDWEISSDVHHPYIEQYLLGVEHELAPDVSLTAQYIHRGTKDFAVLLDRGSVWVPVERRDPGPDGRGGTADDGSVLTLYNKTTVNQELYVLANAPAAYRTYDGIQFIARKRYSENWQLQASYTFSRAKGNINNDPRSNAQLFEGGSLGVFVDPNGQINADGRLGFDFPHEVKLFGTCRVPAWGGLNLSAVYRYHTGMAWARTAAFRDVQGQTFSIRMEPRGSRRLPAISQLDVRVEKTFRRAGSRMFGLFADVFNVSNQGAPTSHSGGSVVRQSGPNFGQPGDWLEPRTLRVGLRLSF